MLIGTRNSRGSVFMLVVILIAIIAALGFFGISVQNDIVGNPVIQSNFSYVWGQISVFWNLYLKDLAIGLWHWAILNVTNLPVGSGNGIPIPQVNFPINLSSIPSPLNALQNQGTLGR